MIAYINPSATFSRATKHHGVLYFTCHCARGATIAEQTQKLCDLYDKLLAEQGSDKEHLLFVTIYISSLSLKEGMNEVYEKWVVKGKQPARVCVEAGIPEGFFLEMCVTAALKEDDC